jgi:Tfp pilus assembly protein PilN
VKKLDLNMGLGKAYQRSMNIWIVFSFVVTLIAIGVLVYISRDKQNDILILTQQINSITAEVSSFDHLVQVKNQTKEYKGQLVDKLKTIDKLSRLKKQAPVHILRELESIMPDSVFIESFSLKKQNIELKGYASSLKDIMFFLNKLEEAKHFKSPNLISIGSEHVEPERDGLTSFTIEALRI